MASLARMALVKRRMRALSDNRPRNVRYSPLFTLIVDQWRTRRILQRYHAGYGNVNGNSAGAPAGAA